jgi:tRNA threonylcarbamoyladenosine biosynthesis protein TsaB
MAKILNIETATQLCSVALSKDGRLIALKESNEKNAHSKILTTFIDEIFEEVSLGISSVDAVAVSMGPGSYTGLRIGVSTAKGICYALDKPLISVSTLQAMAWGMSKLVNLGALHNKKILYVPMIDARRMEVYTAMFNAENKNIRQISAEVIDENSFADYFKTHYLVLAGDGAVKCTAMFSNKENAIFFPDFAASSKFMVEIAHNKFQNQEFENVAYFEPFYLKDFIAGIPRVKGLI